jgi:hypothetical protein
MAEKPEHPDEDRSDAIANDNRNDFFVCAYGLDNSAA